MKNNYLQSTWQTVRDSFKRLWSKPILRLTAFGIAFIPLLYGALYLWAFWNPYGNVDKIPVAIVNEDTGILSSSTASSTPSTTSDAAMGTNHDDSSINYGQTFTNNLLSSKSLDWHETSYSQAQDGLNDRKYYMIVIVPNNFSQSISSLGNATPTRPQIKTITRPATNFLGAQIASRVSDEVINRLNTEITTNYYKSITKNLTDAASGIRTAANGATTLSDGLQVISAGSLNLTNGLTQSVNGSQTLNSGINELSNGAITLSSSINTALQGGRQLETGLSSLNTGAVSLQGGAQQAATVANQLAQGAAQLSNSATQIQQSISQINTVQSQILTNSNNLASGLSSLTQGIIQANDANTVADNALQAFVTAHPELASDANLINAVTELQTSHTITNSLATNASQLSAGANSLASGNQQLNLSLKQLDTGFSQFNQGLSNLNNGTAQLNQGIIQLANGAANLSSGTTSLLSGSQSLSSGLLQIYQGSNQLSIHLSEAHDGSAALSQGLTQLQTGSLSLSNGLQNADDGASSLASGLSDSAATAQKQAELASSEAVTTQFAKPIEIQATTNDPVANYGTGFAPYFIPLALWVGGLMLFFAIQVENLHPKETRSWRVHLGKYISLTILGIVQTILFTTVLRFGLKLPINHLLAFYGFTFLLSFCSIAILDCLITNFGDIGRYIGIIMLMLQLTSSAGTFPLETLPHFFQVIHPYLPMTYAVNGFREIISGSSNSTIIQSSLILLGYTLISLILIWPISLLRLKFQIRHKNNSSTADAPGMTLNHNQAIL